MVKQVTFFLFLWLRLSNMVILAGSGKSYTMMGSLVDEATKGIIPRLCDTLFEMIAEVSIKWPWP